MNYTARNLVIALALALIGIILASSYIGSQKAKITKGTEHVKVLVAKKDVAAGTKISELKSGGYLETKSVVRNDAAPGALHDLDGMEKLATNSNIYAGEQLTGNKIDTVSKLNPADSVRGNERLGAFPVGGVQGVAGLIKTGDHVDILASNKVEDPKTGDDGSATWVVARDVLVWKTPNDFLAEGAEPQQIKANGDDQLYVFKASDKVMQHITWSLAFSDDHHLWLLLRPGAGDQESRLGPEVTIPTAS